VRVAHAPQRARITCAIALAGAVTLAGCGGSTASQPTVTRATAPMRPATPATSVAPHTPATTTPPSAGSTLPRPAHIVVVVLENRAYGQIIGNSAAPYLNRLAANGALLTRSFAIRHPSQPNYLALFSGSTHGLTSDSCPHSFAGANLAAQVRAAGGTFVGYSEALPRPGYSGCSAGDSAGEYARKHAPWTDFPALPARVNQPFTAFPSDYARLPTVSFVIPDLQHDMHDGTIAQGDRWMRTHLSAYATWSRTHNSLLVITWDEDDDTAVNRIPTIVVGARVRTGRYGEHVTHYRMLRTLEALERLPAIGAARQASTITDVWTR
jgi:acid phosphatase